MNEVARRKKLCAHISYLKINKKNQISKDVYKYFDHFFYFPYDDQEAGRICERAEEVWELEGPEAALYVFIRL